MEELDKKEDVKLDKVSEIAKVFMGENLKPEQSEEKPADKVDGDKVELDDEAKKVESEKESEEAKKAEPEEQDDDLKDENPKIQKRIDKLVREREELREELKAEREALQKKIDALENRLDKNEEPIKQAEIETKLDELELNRVNAYLAEDANKKFEERREMTQDAWEEWYSEDPRSAVRWEQKQELRRYAEREGDKKTFAKPADTEINKEKLNSLNKLVSAFPEIGKAIEESRSLKEQGKSDNEIHALMVEKYPDYKLSIDIAGSDHEKYINNVKGAELVAEEMKLRKKSGDKKVYTQAEIDEIVKTKLEQEMARKSQVDTEAGASGSAVKKSGGHANSNLDSIISKVNSMGHTMSSDDYKNAVERRRGMGVS